MDDVEWLLRLAGGTAIMLFEAIILPRSRGAFRWAQDQGITAFGTSAKYVDAVKKAVWFRDHFDLSKVETLLSTGSLGARELDFVYEAIGDDLCVGSITGDGYYLLLCTWPSRRPGASGRVASERLGYGCGCLRW